MRNNGIWWQKPTPRDDKWVITLNRRCVWSGKVGWSDLTYKRLEKSKKEFIAPSSNACLYKSKDDAEATGMGIEICEPFRQAGQGKDGKIYQFRDTDTAVRSASWGSKITPLRKVEAARINLGVCEWDPYWLVSWRQLVLDRTIDLVPNHGRDWLFERAMQFQSPEEAQKYVIDNKMKLSLIAGKHGAPIVIAIGGFLRRNAWPPIEAMDDWKPLRIDAHGNPDS